MNKYSIIIPVRQINDFLKENILYLKKLNYQNFEVLIVVDYFERQDSGLQSRDESESSHPRERRDFGLQSEVLHFENFDFESDPRFKIIVSGPVGPGEKRNIGARECTGNILAFLDDDAYPSENWLIEAEKLFEDSKVYALGGPAITPINAPFLEKVSGNLLESPLISFSFVYRHKPLYARKINDYPTVNLFVKKENFMSVGGFMHEFWPGEDTKLCLDLVKKFGEFNYDPRPIVYHHRRNVFLPHLKQISRYGMHRGQFARIFPETSRLPMYFVPSLFIFGLIFGPIFIYFVPVFNSMYFSILILYLVLIFFENIRFFIKDKILKSLVYFPVGVFLTHFVYGINFVVGYFKRPKLKLKSVNKQTGNYSEG